MLLPEVLLELSPELEQPGLDELPGAEPLPEGKAMLGLTMLRADPCLSTSFQSWDEPPSVSDILIRLPEEV